MQKRKKRAGGRSPLRKTGVSQPMVLDALITVSARRHKATVLTVNWSDFEAIRYYCDVKIMKASDYIKQ